jgi:hypothetical protein
MQILVAVNLVEGDADALWIKATSVVGVITHARHANPFNIVSATACL